MVRRIGVLATVTLLGVGIAGSASALPGSATQVPHALSTATATAPAREASILREMRADLLSPREVAAAVGDRVTLRVDESKCGTGNGYHSCSRTFHPDPDAKGTYSVQVGIVPTIKAAQDSIDGDPGPGSTIVHRGPHRLVFVYEDGEERTAYGSQYQGLLGVSVTCQMTGTSQAATARCAEQLLDAQDDKAAALARALAAGPTRETSTLREIQKTILYVADIQRIVGSAATLTPGNLYCDANPNFAGQRSCSIYWTGTATDGSRFDVDTSVYVDPNAKIAQIQFMANGADTSSRETIVTRTPSRRIAYIIVDGHAVAYGQQIRGAVTIGAGCSGAVRPQAAVQCVSDVLTLQATRAADLS